jgi:Domain of unknown function (DUF4194)
MPNPDKLEISFPVIALLKGVIYRENDENLWHQTIALQAAIRDYVAVLGLEMVLDEGEGFAWLRGREYLEGESALPRIMTRRQLPYMVSLLLALLRKKLAETDSSGSSERLILSRDELVDLIRVFLPSTSNEVKISDQVMTAVNRVEELGFIRRLKNQEQLFEIRRILIAYVDAQWLADFDDRLAGYSGYSRSGEDEYER